MRPNKKMMIDQLKHELGRYKKKVADQQKEIHGIREQLAAAKMSNDMSEAFISLILERCGADEAHPVKTNTKEIGEAVQKNLRAAMKVEDDGTISMWHAAHNDKETGE